MKRYLNRFLVIAGASVLALASCKKDGVLVTTTGGTAGTLSASSTTLVLSKAKYTDTTKVMNFTLTAANYGYNAAVTNTLQIDVPGDNWAKPQSVTLTPLALKQGFSTADLNAILLKLNLPTGVASQVSARIVYTVSSSIAPKYSNVLTLTLTPFALVSYLYVPGAYQGWNPATADSLQSATSNGIYTGVINFTAGNNQFLVTPAKTWDNKYATNEGAKTGTSVIYAAGYNAANNFYAPAAAGYYQVTLDLNANTMTIAPVPHKYSLIGDAGIDWNTDIDMTGYNNGLQAWTLTTTLKSSGGFKFRVDHDWGVSYGLTSPVNGGALTSSNGGNISVAADGTYKITFGVNPADGTAATYTAVKQ